MRELKFRKDNDVLFVEDIKDSDFVGIEDIKDGKIIIAKGLNNNFAGVNKHNNNTIDKWFRQSKVAYIEDFSPKPTKVLIFDNEIEMLIWYNDLD